MFGLITDVVSGLLGGGGGVHVDFAAVEDQMGQVTQQIGTVQDEALGPVKDIAGGVDEFVRGAVGEQLQDYLDSELMGGLNKIVDTLTNFQSQLGSALNSMKQGDDSIFKTIADFIGIF